jgi:hypothetical protein
MKTLLMFDQYLRFLSVYFVTGPLSGVLKRANEAQCRTGHVAVLRRTASSYETANGPQVLNPSINFY